VFETERGGALSADALQYIVREAGKLAKLDVEAHQAFLGHKDIRHTVHYTALSPKRPAAVRVR
jgi:hypothetical protein